MSIVTEHIFSTPDVYLYSPTFKKHLDQLLECSETSSPAFPQLRDDPGAQRFYAQGCNIKASTLPNRVDKLKNQVMSLQQDTRACDIAQRVCNSHEFLRVMMDIYRLCNLLSVSLKQ